MSSVSELSDAELRSELMALGANVGPITPSTRSVYEKQLEKRRRSSAILTSSAAAPLTKPSSPSKSPVRIKRKSTVTNTEITTDLTRRPSNNRKSQVGGGQKMTRAETEESSDSEDHAARGSFENEEQDVSSAPMVLRSRTTLPSTPQEPIQSSAKKLSSQQSPNKKSGADVYPGLLNSGIHLQQQTIGIASRTSSNSPMQSGSSHQSSKVAKRTPTPPRFSARRQLDTSALSYGITNTPEMTSIYSSSTLSNRYVNDLTKYTKSYSTQSDGRFTHSSSGINTSDVGINRRIVNSRVDGGDDDYENEEDDDGHMESSRDLREAMTNRFGGRAISSSSYVPPNYYGSSTKPQYNTFIKSIFQLPSRFFNALTASFKRVPASPTTKPHYERRQAYSLASSQSRHTTDGASSRGLAISRLLLYLLAILFAFLLLAYLATVHTQIFINAGRIAFIIAVGGGIYLTKQRWNAVQAEERRAVFDLIEKITDMIRDSSEQGEMYVAEPHVRDMLIPPSKSANGSDSTKTNSNNSRQGDSPEWRRWQEATNFINSKESRVSAETRIINGAECAVWRWLPAKKTGWQGNAFNGQSQNVPQEALSHCLKLRGMFPSKQASDRDGTDVRVALLQKLLPIRPLHLHVDENSKEGIVFVRFGSLDDCKNAFTALHGTWFNGQLVSAKYLRDERYDQRFPGAVRQ
ncbi:unnamed protein product [Anisakis simplex]|uniref:LEM protein 2 (inferred by orthology to a C. elegans protein) n=1 Tax=Anisakis simplex TaxID=6269 RepID=A0A0M3JRS2_ANISI|nr:unnamed protein product [Anisakis simplex]